LSGETDVGHIILLDKCCLTFELCLCLCECDDIFLFQLANYASQFLTACSMHTLFCQRRVRWPASGLRLTGTRSWRKLISLRRT